MNTVPMTIKGLATLETEHKKLTTIDRSRIISDIATAREHGDLKENAEYHAAKEEQSFVEGRINDIEAKLSLAQVVDPLTLTSQKKVVFSATVLLENLDTQQQISYQIVGEDEADISLNKISYLSPIASAMIGKEACDEVIVRAPKGNIEYEIIKISYQ